MNKEDYVHLESNITELRIQLEVSEKDHKVLNEGTEMMGNHLKDLNNQNLKLRKNILELAEQTVQ